MKWTKKQVEEAHRVVNDIHEGIDNGEGVVPLRQFLAIYADLLEAALQQRGQIATEKVLEILKEMNREDDTKGEKL